MSDVVTKLNSETVLDWIRPVEDPEMRMSLVDLGLIYELKIEDGSEANRSKVFCIMTLTTSTCPAADFIVQQVRDRIKAHPQVESAEVKLVFEPKWDPRTMASEEAKEKLRIW